MRELEWIEDVPVETVTRDELRAREQAEADAIPEQDLVDLTETYGRLGYWDADIDLRQVYTASSDVFDAWYSWDNKQITVVDRATDPLMVHEYVHALQDQHFDLDGYTSVTTSDEQLARRAATEGDANLAADRFLTRRLGYGDLDGIDWSGYLADLRLRARFVLLEATVPLFFAAYPSFAYGYGEAYCAHNLIGVRTDRPRPPEPAPYDWSFQDDLFVTRPPASTLAVMTLDMQKASRLFSLDGVPAPLADRYERFDGDVLGAWYAYVLLFPVLDAVGDASLLAQRLRGDQVLFFTDRLTGSRGVAWSTLWASTTDALAAEEALRALHDVTPDADEARLGVAKDGETVWLEWSGQSVVFIKNVEAPDAAALASAALAPSAPASADSPHLRPRPLRRILRRFERHH